MQALRLPGSVESKELQQLRTEIDRIKVRVCAFSSHGTKFLVEALLVEAVKVWQNAKGVPKLPLAAAGLSVPDPILRNAPSPLSSDLSSTRSSESLPNGDRECPPNQLSSVTAGSTNIEICTTASNATTTEAAASDRQRLQTLRQRELDRVNHAQKSSASSNLNEGWFIISDKWLRSWKAFLAGADRPGPIDNAPLLSSDGMASLFLFSRILMCCALRNSQA